MNLGPRNDDTSVISRDNPRLIRLAFWSSFAICGIVAAFDIFLNAASIHNGNTLHLAQGEFVLLVVRLLAFGFSPLVKGKIGIVMLVIYVSMFLGFLLSGTNS